MKRRGRNDGDSWSPDFPAVVNGFLLLADARSTEWGLYKYSFEEDASWRPPYPADGDLCALIESGYRYPPALALARSAVSKVFKSEQASLDQFADAYRAALEYHLGQQSDAGYVLARTCADEFGYLWQREWFWILSVTEDSPAQAAWVSDDFFVYRNAASDFLLTEAQLDRLRQSR